MNTRDRLDEYMKYRKLSLFPSISLGTFVLLGNFANWCDDQDKKSIGKGLKSSPQPSSVPSQKWSDDEFEQ